MWWLSWSYLLPAFRIPRSWVTGHFDSFADTASRAYRDCKKQWVSDVFRYIVIIGGGVIVICPSLLPVGMCFGF